MTQAPIALTMGDPAGIGGELTLAAWRDRAEDLPVFFALDDPARLSELARRIGITAPIREIAGPEDAAAIFATALPVLPVPLAAVAVPGRPDPANGRAVLSSIDQAVALVQAGRAAAMVTNPIQKSTLYETGFRHPGHTEYLADLAGVAAPPVMMLEGGGLRVALVTIHLPLAAVPNAITPSRLTAVIEVLHADLQHKFGISDPVILICGLNPHAGESGHLGREEIEVIEPVLKSLRARGLRLRGPVPADTAFIPAQLQGVDAVLAMYHDQGLPVLKHHDFAHAVNVTLGLPFVRTSPDHGTAFDIAGSGRADPSSLVAALRMARRLASG